MAHTVFFSCGCPEDPSLSLHPRDAEHLVSVAVAGSGGRLEPNATTLRTLDKIWAAHDQLHG